VNGRQHADAATTAVMHAELEHYRTTSSQGPALFALANQNPTKTPQRVQELISYLSQVYAVPPSASLLHLMIHQPQPRKAYYVQTCNARTSNCMYAASNEEYADLQDASSPPDAAFDFIAMLTLIRQPCVSSIDCRD
jgi:hypothetical protein